MAPLAFLGFLGFAFGHLLEHELFIALGCGSNVVPLGLVIAQHLQLLFIAQLKVFHLHEMLRAALLILVEFARLSLYEDLVLLLIPYDLIQLVLLLALENVGVLPLVVHLLLLEALLHVGFLLDLLQVAAPRHLPILFLLLLVDLAHALLLLDRLLGLLADAVEDIAALLIFDRPALLVPLVLNSQHVISLVPVQFFLCLDLLLPLGALLV